MLRIFIATTQTSSVFAALYAKRTAAKGNRDILMLDAVRLRSGVAHEIKKSCRIHPWHEVIDLSSPIEDSVDLKPTLLKKLTRNLKNKPVIRVIYDTLYSKQQSGSLQALLRILETRLKHISREKAELYLLTQTRINGALIRYFPQASVNYMEHGLGDYLYVQEEDLKKHNFYCLFHAPFQKFLEGKNLENAFVIPAFEATDFEKACRSLIEGNPAGGYTKELSGNGVLILMENVEMYQVPPHFWSAYIDKCLEQVPDHKNHFYLIKPHHLQSEGAIQATKAHFHKLGLQFRFIDEKEIINCGAEVLFAAWHKGMSHVFSIFSSSLFYLSVLYPDPRITYHYSIGFMEKYVEKAPLQFRKHFRGLEELIREVFSGNCKAFS